MGGAVALESRTEGSLRAVALICARQWDGICYRPVQRADEVAAGESRRAGLLHRMPTGWTAGR